MELERAIFNAGISLEEAEINFIDFAVACGKTPNAIREAVGLEPIGIETFTIPTNCKNCGAPIEYSKQNHNSICKCSYCGTEYIINVSNSK